MKDVLSEPENIGSQTSNNKMMNKEKEACKDLKSTKTCKKLKKKNEGKGCENKSVKKKCKKTCGLCDIGKSFSCSTHWQHNTLSVECGFYFLSLKKLL